MILSKIRTLKIISKKVIDLIDKMLQLDPTDRITVEDALAHPCMTTFHDSDDEPEGYLFDDMYESEEYSVDEWKSNFKRSTRFSTRLIF